MDINKINWKKKGIEELQARYGYDYNVAKTMYMRLYKKAWYETKHKHKVSEINIAYETYVSTFGSENSVKLFDIQVGDTSYKLDFSPAFKGKDDISKAFIQARFEGFKKAYGESSINYKGEQKSVNEVMEEYDDGDMEYDDFIEYIEEFRNSAEYNKASYKG